MAAEEEDRFVLDEKGYTAVSTMVIRLVDAGYDLDKDHPSTLWQAAGFLVGKDEYDFNLNEIAVLLTFVTDNWEIIKAGTKEIIEKHGTGLDEE